ncbi:V-type ATP synthase subunit F [Geobacter sulfurreducens]|uniref:V-type ATP synthase subunit F n=1 Tax=Geobacter sulfurreducens TaxID=35554 RepID=UPI002B9EFF54|nr:V-type ATP synthase subunit F [Geobacter sulfurreducens]HML78565.1 V-type ATP synthase subunit F [Geobacter sulfurreducens]
MKRIVFITPADARYGFSLAGVTQLTAAPAEAEAAVRQAMADPECGLVVIDERLLLGIGEERFQEMERRWFGVLIVLPAPEAAGNEEEDYAARLIRRVIGYHVRLMP